MASFEERWHDARINFDLYRFVYTGAFINKLTQNICSGGLQLISPQNHFAVFIKDHPQVIFLFCDSISPMIFYLMEKIHYNSEWFLGAWQTISKRLGELRSKVLYHNESKF